MTAGGCLITLVARFRRPTPPQCGFFWRKRVATVPPLTRSGRSIAATFSFENLHRKYTTQPSGLPIPYMHPRGGRGEGASWKVAGKRWVPPRFEASPSNYHTLGSPRPSIYIKALFFLVETRHTSQMILAASNIAKLAFNRITFL